MGINANYLKITVTITSYKDLHPHRNTYIMKIDMYMSLSITYSPVHIIIIIIIITVLLRTALSGL